MALRYMLVFILLGISVHVSEAGPVLASLKTAVLGISEDGCSCTSACGKSWHQGGSEWCYVGKQCRLAGWDSCHEEAGSIQTHMLYSEAKGKGKAEKTTESKSLWQRLKDQLKQTHIKEVEEESELKVAEKKLNQETDRRLRQEAALVVVEAKLKKTQQHSSEQELQLTLFTKHEAEEKAELAATRAQLKAELETAEIKENTLKKQLRSALDKEAEAELKAAAAESKEQKSSSSAAQKQVEGAKAVQEAQKKADDAEAKRKEEHAKVMAWEATHHKDLVTHQEDAFDISDRELRLSGKEKQLLKTDKKAKVAYAKFKATEKAMLKVKAQASEAEKKLAASISENTKLKGVKQKYIDVQKKLEASEREKQEAYAELKPFHDAIQKAVLA